MRLIRAFIRLWAFLGVTVLVHVVHVIGTFLLNLAPSRKLAWHNWIVRVWARLLLRVFGITCRSDGPVPADACLILSNHLGYLDIPVIAAHTSAVFVAKAEVNSWPLFGRLCRSVGTIFIDRGSKKDVVRVAGEIREAIRAGRSVVLFPEGTSSGGKDILPFKSSLLEVVADGSIDRVRIAVIGYECDDLPAEEVMCWVGDAEFLPHVWQLFQLPSARAAVHFGEVEIEPAHRKELAKVLHGHAQTRLATLRQSLD